MKLNTRRTILVGLAFLSISAFWQLYDSLIPLILKNTFQVSDTISGGIMAGAFFVHLLWIALPALMIFAASLSSLMAHILKLRKLQK